MSGTAARELAEATAVSKRHVAKTLARLLDKECCEGIAKHGADVYRAESAPSGVVDLGEDEIANDSVWGSYTWSIEICSLCPLGGGQMTAGSHVVRVGGEVTGEQDLGLDTFGIN
jgi:hypothetical protein